MQYTRCRKEFSIDIEDKSSDVGATAKPAPCDDSPKEGKERKGLTQKMLLSLMSIIFFFFAAELIVRLSGLVDLRVCDPLYRSSEIGGLAYELKPNFEGSGYGARIKTNSYGLRDSEFPIEKPEGTYRIVVLGDSFTFGYGVEQGETFVERLESMLNDCEDINSHTRFEVINCGVMGYNTTQERIFFESVAVKFRPDLVIVYTIDNDFGQMYFRERDGFLMRSEDKVESVPERIRFWLAKRSYLCKLVFSWLRAFKGKSSTAKTNHSALSGKKPHSERYWDVASYGVKKERVDDLKRIAALSKEIHARFLLVLHDLNKDALNLIASALKHTDAHILDMAPFWRNHGGDKLVIPHDIHPNKEGHLFIAKRIFEKLRAEKLIPHDKLTE